MRFRMLVLVFCVFSATAQAKSLYWQRLDVKARLDADGALHTSETQTIVFDGDWNGGERIFRVGPEQALAFEGISRIENGQEIPLKQGSLDNVDDYSFTSTYTMRWRSRRPEDPPFQNTAITYRLNYTLTGVVQKRGSTYLLNHDFAFPDRSGVIEHFTLHVDIDPVWGGGVIDEAREQLQPGQSVIVTRKLTYSGSGAPAVPEGIDPLVLRLIATAMLVVIGVLGIQFFNAEKATGRLAALRSPDSIDESWLGQHVFKLSPEIAGACWDTDIDAPEVAAALARMAVEKKIASEVKKSAGLFGGKPVLHLRLLVDRKELTGYERELVDKLFFDGRNETDTESVRENYKSTGLDLAAVIRPAIEKELENLPHWREKAYAPPIGSDILTALVIFGALVAFAVMGNDSDKSYAFACGLVGIISGVVAAIAAGVNRRKITSVIGRYVLVGAMISPIIIVALYLVLNAGAYMVHLPMAIGAAAWALALFKLVIDAMRIPDLPATIVFRKEIAAAREYFAAQLRSPSPRLRDEWLPYLLAFGLGKNVDQWFRSMGGATATSSTSGFGSSSSISSASSGWTGGGGTFGGAGATGAWTVAAGALAAGVAAPSSSSSGGGGGSSSGGGGGGGW